MMKKNSLFLILICLIAVIQLQAQQLYHFNQYLFNDLILNPAVAGTGPCKVIGLDSRKQWYGFDGSPRTQNIYFHGTFFKKTGLGVIILNDNAGAIKITGGELDYSYHAIKNKNHILTFGLGASILNYKIDQSGFNPEFKNDPTLTTASQSKTNFDISSGIYYRNKYFLVSLGAKNLLQTKLNVSNTNQTKIVRNYFFNATYNFILNKKIRFEPSVFLSSIGKPIPQIYGATKFVFYDLFWLGAGYRMRDAVVLFCGAEIGQFTVGYGFDYSTSLIRAFNNGGHEVVIKFNFCKKNKDNLFKAEETKRGSKSGYCPVW